MPSKAYFQSIAQNRIKSRKANAYYWNDITRYCDYFIHEDSSVLDIGCGTGELLAEVKGKDKTGIDFSEAMIDLAKSQYPDLDFRVMDASNIQLEKKYDVIIISNLVGYLDYVQAVFDQLKKVCDFLT